MPGSCIGVLDHIKTEFLAMVILIVEEHGINVINDRCAI